MSTPNGAVIRAVLPDGSTVDVTEGVQALYDLVIDSMDWGSGFLTIEDARPVAHVAYACGFDTEAPDEYIAGKQHEIEEAAYRATNPASKEWIYWNTDHPHAYSSVGRCMWNGCDCRQGREEEWAAEGAQAKAAQEEWHARMARQAQRAAEKYDAAQEGRQ